MALLDYMGDAPGFMSYRRTPQRDLTNIPKRTAPEKKELKDETFEFDAKGNPGDRQFVYNQQKDFNQGLQQLYSQYDGEMSWVTADPKYKQLVAESQWAIYDKDAAEQNEVTSRDREKKLSDINSGHHGSDIELERQPDGSYIPKFGNTKSGFASKEEYLQQVIEEPQLVQREDGSVGLKYVDFDNGIGSEKEFESFMTNIFTGGNIGMTRGAGTVSKTQEQAVTAGMDFAIKNLTKTGYDNATNYQQIEDGVNYLVAYGMNDQQEYFLWNSFYKDVAKQKSFKMPKTDENGEILKDERGKAILEDVFVSDEDLVDPNKRKTLFNLYVQDRVMSYSEKFKEKSTSTVSERSTTLRNVDAGTGKVIEDPDRRWESVVKGSSPAGPGFTKTESYPTWKGGKLVGQEHDLIVYDNSNFAPGMEQASKALIGKTIGDIDNTGIVQVGKKWNKVNSTIKGMQISDVHSVRQVPRKDGKGVSWVARVLVVADNDETFGDLNYWNPETESAEPVFSGWMYQDVDEYAEGKVGGYMLKSDAKNKGYKINGDTDETSTFDIDDDEVSYLYIDVPVDNQLLYWDSFAVGETREAEAEDIEVDASRKGVEQQKGKNANKEVPKEKVQWE